MNLKLSASRENGKQPYWHYAISIMLFLTGCAISFTIYFTHSETLKAREQELISRVHITVYNSIQREIDRNVDALMGLKTSFIASGGLTRKQFGIYSDHYIKNIRSIQALEWVPRITHQQRDSAEKAAQREGFPDFQIIQRAGNQSIRAENRPEYFPVYYLEPLEGNETALGFDPGEKGVQRFKAIQQAIKTGNAAASDVMTLIQDKHQKHAILVFVPIMEHELNSLAGNHIHSLVEGVYVIDELVNTALSNYKIPSPIEVRVQEVNNPANVLYSNVKESEVQNGTQKPSLTRILTIADQQWQLTTMNTGENVFAVISPYWILIVGFVLTVLIVITVFRFLTDNRKELKLYAKKLEIKNKELEQYAYVAAHDLQEPLHTMSSLVDLLREDGSDKLSDHGRIYLDYIGQAAGRMTSLIQDLLNYSRIGSTEVPQQVNCNELLQQVMNDLRQRIQATSAQIQIAPLPTLMGYPTALRQLFHNLITNAIKFQPAGQTPHIEIAAKKMADGWLFSVKDNGIGIPREQHESVFVLFKRLHRKDTYAGNGIGLTYCRKAVEMHNGEIWIDSEPGKGSAFTFFLNLH